MDTNKFAELLKKYNNGISRGSKRKLAKELGCNETTISNISSGRAKPSEELAIAMAKVLKIETKELQKIFETSSADGCAGNSKSLVSENRMLKEKIKFLEERNSFLQEQVLFYKKNAE